MCEEAARLLAEYDVLVRAYSTTVTQLRSEMGRLQREDYVGLQLNTEQARLDVEIVRSKLERHMREHGC